MRHTQAAILWLLKCAAGGLISYGAPRLLVALGIPLDTWIVTMAGWLSVHITAETAQWAATVAAGVILLAGAVVFGRRKHVDNLPSATGRSALKISCGETGPFFKTGGTESHTKRTYKVKIENIGTIALSNCRMWISKIEPEQDSGYEPPWVIKTSLSINAGDFEFFPFAVYGESRNSQSAGDTFFHFFVEGHSPLPEIKQPHIVTIRATANETTPAEMRCKLWVDEFGRFRIAAV